MKHLLNDPRDLPHLKLYVQCVAVVIPAAALLYALDSIPWGLALTYVALWSFFGDRFTMSYHCTLHRRLFRKEYAALDAALDWVLAPFFGQTPGTFHVHHMGMHHVDDNLPGDLSSTMRYQRDSALHFLRYYLRFACLILFELAGYLRRTGNTKLLRRFLAGELSYYAALAALAYWNLEATLIVFVFPFVFVRLMMMLGNWVQHAFIDPDRPDDPYRSSINTIEARFNARVFNAGYHIYHHVRKGTHYSELATEFAQNRHRYGCADAVVFDGIGLFGIWFLLITGQHARLARHFVRLPGAPERSEEEVIALFRRRLAPIQEWTAPDGLRAPLARTTSAG